MSAMNHKADAKKMCDLYRRICYVTKVPRLECTHCLTKRLGSGAHAPCAGEVSEDEAQREGSSCLTTICRTHGGST